MAEQDGQRLNRRRFLRLTAGMGLAASSAGLLAACAPAAAPSPAAGAKPGATTAPAQKKTRDLLFLLDIAPYGKHALFYAALDHGEFARAGFNVKFESAKGSADNAQKLAAKAADFGFCDTASLILARGLDAMIKETFMVHYRNLMCMVSLKKTGITRPKDMEGKTIAATSGDAPRALLPAFAKLNNFDHTKVNLLTLEQPAKIATVLAGHAQGALDFYTSFPAWVVATKPQGEEAVVLQYADYGLDIYNNGIITHDDTLKNEPNLVKEFLGALGEAMLWTVHNPDEANAITLKYNPALARDTARAQLQIALDVLLVDEVKKNGIGPMSKDKMETTLKVVSENFPLKRPVALDEIWTNEFTPRGLIPKV